MLTVAQNAVAMHDAINAEKREASGENIAVTGVSSLEHVVDVKLGCKDYLQIKTSGETTAGGLNVRYNSDRSITIFSGTSTAFKNVYPTENGYNKFSVPAGSYIFSCENARSHILVLLDQYRNGSIVATYRILGTNSTCSFEILEGDTVDCLLQVYAGYTLTEDITLYPRLTQDIQDFTNIPHTSRNLLPYPYADTTKNHKDITWTDNGDGTITANGTATGYSRFGLLSDDALRNFLVDGEAYTWRSNGSVAMVLSAQDATGAWKYWGNGTGVVIDKSTYTYADLYLQFSPNAVADEALLKPQLELGSAATAYEPPASVRVPATITRYGKNLLPDAAFDANNWYSTTSGHYYNLTGLSLGNYVISAKYVTQADNYYGYWYINVSSDNFVTEKTAAQMCVGSYVSPKTSIAFTINAGEKARFYWYGKGDVTPFITYVRDPQIELGSTATAYEPHVEPVTYTSTADGTVPGVTSLSPSMTLMSNSSGVIINCKYFSSGSDRLRTAASSCLQKLKNLRNSLGEYLKSLQ
jgi:hypothetical protein